jgi:hypothetical protein
MSADPSPPTTINGGIPAEIPDPGPSPLAPWSIPWGAFFIGRLVAFLEIEKPPSSRGGLKVLSEKSLEKTAAGKAALGEGGSSVGLHREPFDNRMK